MTPQWEDAVGRGAVRELTELLALGADVDAKDRHGHTALMIAARDGRQDVAGLLVKHGASLDHTAKYGLSALMIAVVRRHADVVRTLAEAGACLTLRGTGAPGFAGKTAMDLASEIGDAELIEALHRR
jgi:ankyrin repeat protein